MTQKPVKAMTDFFGSGPLYFGSWMDTGLLAYFSESPPPLALAALAVPLVVGLWTRSRGLALAGGLTLAGSLFMMSLFLPLTFWGGTAIILYLIAFIGGARSSRRESAPPLILGGVVLILAIALGFPRSHPLNTSVCHSNLKNISTALSMWATDHEGELPTNLGELMPNYLNALPQCNKVAYAYQGQVAWCQNPEHEKLPGASPGYPRLAEDGTLLTKPE